MRAVFKIISAKIKCSFQEHISRLHLKTGHYNFIMSTESKSFQDDISRWGSGIVMILKQFSKLEMIVTI